MVMVFYTHAYAGCPPWNMCVYSCICVYMCVPLVLLTPYRLCRLAVHGLLHVLAPACIAFAHNTNRQPCLLPMPVTSLCSGHSWRVPS